MRTPFNYTEPDWAPLERAVQLAGLPVGRTMAEFWWMHEQPEGVHHYKHRDTRLYALLAANTPETMCAAMLHSARGK